jgi:chromosome partitioning protein
VTLGTGNTTLAVHLAAAATLAGFHAAVIDLDPQGSAASWRDDRASAPGGSPPPKVVSGQASRLPVLLDGAAKQGFDLVLIDTGPNADTAARRAAEASDLVIIPCRPATFDLKAIKTTIHSRTVRPSDQDRMRVSSFVSSAPLTLPSCFIAGPIGAPVAAPTAARSGRRTRTGCASHLPGPRRGVAQT